MLGLKLLVRGVLAGPRRSLSSTLADSCNVQKRWEDSGEEAVKLPVIFIQVTSNNTIITISDKDGAVKGWTSAGAEGFKNARRGTTFAAQTAGLSAARKALKLNYHTVKVKLKGIGQFRQAALKGLEEGGINVAVMQDVTPIPMNGPRPRKQKRL